MRLVAKYSNMTFAIVEVKPQVGFYFYLYDNLNKCIKENLQDSVPVSKYNFVFLNDKK